MATKLQILSTVKMFPRKRIDEYSELLNNSNAHTIENQFHALYKEGSIQRAGVNKFFKNDVFYITKYGNDCLVFQLSATKTGRGRSSYLRYTSAANFDEMKIK